MNIDGKELGTVALKILFLVIYFMVNILNLFYLRLFKKKKEKRKRDKDHFDVYFFFPCSGVRCLWQG